MSIRFEDSARPLSDTLRQVRAGITTEEVTLGELLRLIGEQGLLLFVMFLMTPFLLPVSIPGMSTVFSVIAILVGLGVMMNRIPWLPQGWRVVGIDGAQGRLSLRRGATVRSFTLP